MPKTVSDQGVCVNVLHLLLLVAFDVYYPAIPLRYLGGATNG